MAIHSKQALKTELSANDKKVRAKVRKVVEEHPDLVMEALLKKPFWPQDVETMMRYVRMNDDNRGLVSVAFSPDSDGWIDCMSIGDPDEPGYSMRFRTHNGGGVSPHTRNALLILAAAIRLDNLERPQERGKPDSEVKE